MNCSITSEAEADEDALTASGRTSPFAVEDGLYRLLEKGFEQFIGRTQLRADLKDAVMRDPRIWIINVHGPGGVGKSSLVNWCVYDFYESRDFESIIQLTAKETVLTTSGIEQFSRSLYSLENLLDHVLLAFGETPPQDLEDKQRIATEFLSAWKTLLVLDNMETVQDGRILSFIQGLPGYSCEGPTNEQDEDWRMGVTDSSERNGRKGGSRIPADSPRRARN